MNKFYKSLPVDIVSILKISEGWLVGGAALSEAAAVNAHYYDIIVSNRENFQKSTLFLDKICDEWTCNSNGGLKFKIADITIDIWCQDFEDFVKLQKAPSRMYNFSTGTMLTF